MRPNGSVGPPRQPAKSLTRALRATLSVVGHENYFTETTLLLPFRHRLNRINKYGGIA